MSTIEPLAAGEYLFTSESVTEGHPDKVCDQISDAILDAVMAGDPEGRVACETMVNTGMAVVSGEISTDVHLDVPELVRETIREIGYDHGDYGYNCDHISVLVSLDKQSPDIAQGVDASHETRTGSDADDELLLAGAGDQGMMCGYATDETEALMPMPVHLAHRLAERLAAVRKDGTLDYLGPDGKTQVTVRYAEGRPVRVEKLLISTQHAAGVDSQETIRPDLWQHDVLPEVGPDRLLGVDAGGVLGGDQQLLDPHRAALGVADGDLGLAVRPQVVERAVLAYRGEPLGQPVGEVDRHRHQCLGLVGRVAEHHPLVAGPGQPQFVVGVRAGARLVRGVDALGDVGRLLVERDQDRDVVAVVAVVAVVVADLADRLADQLGHVEVDVGRDLAGDDGHPGVDHGLAGDATLRVAGHDRVEDGVGNLVADLVWVTLGDRLGRE